MPFYPSIGAQAMKKYFTPMWKEFASYGDLDDVLEVGLAAAIRASGMQLKVLGLQAVVDSMRTAYEHFKVDLRESESNVLNLTKQLDNANVAQKETQSLRESLKAAKKRRKEAEAKVARLLGEKKEMEAKWRNVEAEFVANFHNTKAYTNFSDYFARVGHQKVLTMLRTLEARFPPPDVEGEEDS
ncbi:hypothetical protein Adt_28197 [Abeliophyllum distichum]|uniref:Uncharacterized protein n=1 Tax=Abeliophyllum distichum TaxID=126358 RepID=A0ABD1RX41_9LAMI